MNVSDIRNREIIKWYEDFNEPIFKFIFMMIQDYQQAEDLRHETFLKAYIHYDSYRRKSNPKTWLFSIAHNLTIDFIRKRKPILLFKEAFFFKKDTNPLPDEMIQIKESSYELYKALGVIKDSYREVIILRKIKEFSIEETAEVLGWSESKVKSTLYRAIPVLEKQLLKEGYLREGTIYKKFIGY
ncbi:RNA polymerase sigma factor [Neobacillus rhizosphaerae]|uniref:RNA polymerase sigma factor n=1 Tax=Neobacillus rhizosphaerae TaxID=2880965 RepID=UPI00200D3DBD|nr:RNA polymerase sigma factor [Neobacillus rhizosphaerae]